MADAVQLQADIGALGLQGFGAFSTILAALSADNVAPMAMVHMESLGRSFPLSGKSVRQVPDVLQRSSMRRIGRFAIAVGWKKGDSCSLLASTAEGQAIALLSVALRALFTADHCGQIMSTTYENLFPDQPSVASVAQLADMTDLIAAKMAPMGFGNFLAAQVMRMGSAFEGLRLRQPSDLLEDLTVESASELLCFTSRAVREASTILRITGTAGMGHILGLILFLFPDNVMVTIQGVTIHRGQKLDILLEVSAGPSAPAVMVLEHRMMDNELSPSRLVLECQPEGHHQGTGCGLKWQGWLANHLQLLYARFGLSCTAAELTQHADLVVSLAECEILPEWDPDFDETSFRRLSDHLGSHPWDHMALVCRDILGISPSRQMSLQDAFPAFATRVQRQVDAASLCGCSQAGCDFLSGWDFLASERAGGCRAELLWHELGASLDAAIASFFVSAGPAVTVARPRFSSPRAIAATRTINKALSLRHDSPGTYRAPSSATLYRSVLQLVEGARGPAADTIAVSAGATIYPQVLDDAQDPGPPGRGAARFHLVDGRIGFRGHAYARIITTPAEPRPKAADSLERDRAIVPSTLGVHSDLLMTVREKTDCLQLRTSLQYGGVTTELDLREVYGAWMMVERSAACAHPATAPLTVAAPPVVVTSVARPCAAPPGAVAVVMTRGSRAAQVVACDRRARAMLMDECCLDCAVKQAVERKFKMIIVT